MTKNKTPKTYEQAKKDYNDLMFDLGLEFLSIGTDFSEDTDGWNVRDMVSECQYQLDVHYEEDNANADGRYPSELVEHWGLDEDEAMEMHRDWKSRTMKLRNFIRKYQALAMQEACTQGHCSKFD